ncbi:MAG: cytidylate kinase-like family protein [Lachnospiraceae bacterium]|nr:cytidylate kinase-like family protein [Lachnospiraceae bacterium]
MAKYFITISRQFGSMGRSIAKELSEILQIDYLDRDIVEETSKRMGLPVSFISKEEEAAKTGFFDKIYPLGVGVPNLQDELFSVQGNIIRDFAAKESGIIVGRCGDYVLREQENLLSVYVYASYEKRLENCTQILGMDERTAKRMIREVDTARENYHKTYIPGYMTPFDHRDLCIDSGRFGIKKTAEYLAEIAKKEFF